MLSTWCSICRKDGCDCPYCHGARFLRFKGQLIRCDVCNAAPEPVVEPPVPPVRQPRRVYADRLDS